MKSPVLLSALLAAILVGTPAVRAGTPIDSKAGDCERTYKVREVDNVTYYDGRLADSFRHKLDIFVPKDKKDFPVVVFLHGGAGALATRAVSACIPPSANSSPAAASGLSFPITACRRG